MTAKGRRWARLLSEMLVKFNLRPNPVLIMPGGLAGVAHGFQYMIEGKVRIQSHTLTSTFSFHTGGVLILLGKRREDYLPDRRYCQRVSEGCRWTIGSVWPDRILRIVLYMYARCVTNQCGQDDIVAAAVLGPSVLLRLSKPTPSHRNILLSSTSKSEPCTRKVHFFQMV